MKIEAYFISTDRYAFDFGDFSPAKGWAQVDTDQDASYFGTWANPVSLMIVQYCEGDVTCWRCESPEEFRDQIVEMNELEIRGGRSGLKIDPGLNPERVAAWDAHPDLLGFLH